MGIVQVKTYKIIISQTAKRDIKENLSYIENILGNITAAKRLSEDIRIMVDLLAVQPYHNPIITRKELKDMNIRIGHVRNYNIFYTIGGDDDRVEILRFLHQRQNWIEIIRNKADADLNLLHEDPTLYDPDNGTQTIIEKNSAEIRNNYNQISELANKENAIIRITQRGKEDIFVMSVGEYERLSKFIL